MTPRHFACRTLVATAAWLTLAPAPAWAQTPVAQPAPAAAEQQADTPDSGHPAAATRLQVAGFGSIGWARSNRSWTYLRFIDERGTAQADTLLGAQADLQFDSHWSAALQVKIAPSTSSESSWRLRPSWAFVAWRPSNDWLLRAGRLRLPAYLNSEQLDVAATYTQARLPPETYAVLPPENLDSVNLTRTWPLGSGEMALDLYSGRSKQTLRTWVRDGIGDALPAGANFIRMTTEAQGLVATWSDADAKARLGMHRVVVTPPSHLAIVVRPTWVPLGPGLGYWQTTPGIPGPGVETVSSVTSYYLTGGVEFSPAPGWKVASELSRVRPVGTDRSIDTRGGYLSVTRQLGRWSPYLSFGRLVSSDTSLTWARTLDETTLPAGLPGAEPLNASMRVSAELAPVYDQRSWAFGAAYALSATGRLKAEWLHTRATVSSMFDLPSGARLFQPRSVDLLSVNYSFTF